MKDINQCLRLKELRTKNVKLLLNGDKVSLDYYNDTMNQHTKKCEKCKEVEDIRNGWTKEEVIKAVRKAQAEAQPNSWGAEDDGYNEYMGELEMIIEGIEEGLNQRQILDDLCFYPEKYL